MQPTAQPPPPESPPTLLVVDDEPGILDIYRNLLGPRRQAPVIRSSRRRARPTGEAFHESYNLLVADSGEHAIELMAHEYAQGRRVRGGFFDMKMPGGIDGLETIRRVLRIDPEVHCVVVSAYQDQPLTELRAAFEGRQDYWDYLSKPFTPEEISQKARNIVASWDRRRQEEFERMRIEHELRLAQKLEAIGMLAHGIAHEINTPMQYLAINLSFLEDSVQDIQAYFDDPVDSDVQLIDVLAEMPEALATMRDGVHRVTEIVRAMRSFARRDSSSKELYDVNQAVTNTLEVARSEYKQVACAVTDLEELPEIACHVGGVQQVLLNLVVNAAHAIAARGYAKPTDGLIRITTRADDDHVLVLVEDNGTGISPEHADRVFEPFFTTKAVGHGSGQGLSLARNIVVDGHGGTLTFGPGEGGGTRFTVRLPRR